MIRFCLARAASALAMCATVSALGIAQPSPETTSGDRVLHGRTGAIVVNVPRVTDDVRIDGALTEEVWSRAALLTGFSQYQPVDGRPAGDSTEVLVAYSDRALLIGIRAWEPHGAVITGLANRDRIEAGDHVRIFLDTYNDRRRAFVFAVNPYGVQADGVYSESGSGSGSTDPNPDFVFESRGRLTDYGYEVEIRIPFKSLRYASTNDHVWGFNVLRYVQHSGTVQSWTPAENSRASFLAQSGTLTGLSNLSRGIVLDATPTVVSQATGAPRSATDPAWQYRTATPELSGTVRWGITPNLSLSGTANPDFSQVEADVGQVIYDPRAAISYPETRPFFLEGIEHFETPNRLIHTRSIASPSGAMKLAGKAGNLNVGLLSAMDEVSGTAGVQRPMVHLARLRRDLGGQSNAGFVYTDRSDGDAYNRVLGTDTRLLFGPYVVTGQVASSFTGAAGSPLAARPLFDVRTVRTGRARGWSALLSGVHPEFRAQSGFIPRAGIARANVTPRWTFFPQTDRVQSVTWSTIFDGTWEWDRFVHGTEPNDMKWQTNTVVTWRGGWRTRAFTFVESFKYPAFLYTNYFIERRDAAGAVQDTVAYTGTDRLPNYGVDLELATPQFQRFAASANLTAGHDDNFDEWSSAWIMFTTFNADWRPTGRLRVNGRWVEQRFHRVSDGSLVRQRIIPRLKLEYQLGRPVYVRFVSQYDAMRVDALRDDSRTNDPILLRNPDGSFRRAEARQAANLRTDWLFSYQPNPGTVLFLGYGATLRGTRFFEPSLLDRTTDGVFVKASYLLRM